MTCTDIYSQYKRGRTADEMSEQTVRAIVLGAFYGMQKAKLHKLITKQHGLYAPYQQMNWIYDQAVEQYGQYDPLRDNAHGID